MQARRARTRRLIELGGLVHKSGLADRLSDDRAALMGALMLAAETLTNADAQRSPAEITAHWRAIGRAALKTPNPTNTEPIL
jgi:conjugative transfer protein TraD